jgi:hypothetical protein
MGRIYRFMQERTINASKIERGGVGVIKAVLWGLGAMGSGIALLLEEKGVEIVGAIDVAPKVGKDLGDILGSGKIGVTVEDDPAKALAREPDLAIICTASFVKDVFPHIKSALEYGANVITIAEEMAYPWAADNELAHEMDCLAREAGKTILGTGINPGFILDTLVLALTGVCREVRHIHAKRINNLAPFGPTVMRTQGVGITPEEFQEGLRMGSVVGHVGFRQSAMLIGRGLNWDIERVVEEKQPIISRVERRTRYAHVLPGNVAGCRHIARAYSGGKEVILLEHPQQICPEAEGVETGDYINVDGDPPVNLAIKPEIPGGIGTTAIAVNMIPQVLVSPPGLVTMADLPVPRALLGSLSKHQAVGDGS